MSDEQEVITRLMQNWLEDMPGGFPASHIGYENEEFDPADLGPTDPYMLVYMVFGQPENPTKGADFHREVGFLQATLKFPKKQGTGPAGRHAGLIKNRFVKGTTLSEDSMITVVVDRTPEVSRGPQEDDRYIVIVRARFYANVFRS